MSLELPYGDGAIGTRWREQRRRRRMLYGGWRNDLSMRAQSLVGTERKRAWKFMDMSANPFMQLCEQFSTLYDREPQVKHATAGDLPTAVMEVALETCGYWALMQRVQRDTVGIRDMFVRLDIDDEAQLVCEQVFPDYVGQVRYDMAGRKLKRFEQLVARPNLPEDRPGEDRWFWDVLEVDDKTGSWKVMRDAGGKPGDDVTRFFREPGEYPYVRRNGRPFIPVARYRAAVLGVRHWDYSEWQEVVEGSLNVAVYWTFWGHVYRAASWPQRYAVGVSPVTSTTGDEDARQGVETDPATLLLLKLAPGYEGQPLVSQWGPGGDVDSMAKAVSMYEARIAAGVGISPSDLTRTSGDPRSGYALAVSREAQREQQAKLKPAFRQGDIVALEIIAALLNRMPDLPELPESGWRPDYVSLPLSVEERRELRDEVFALLDRRYIDEIEAMRRLNGHTMSRQEAAQELERVRSGMPAPAQPAAPAAPPTPGDET